VYAPTTETKGETFLWYSPDPKVSLGVAYLWKQGAFRGLANFALTTETERTPLVRVGAGLQGIGTGNPGYFGTVEKNRKIGSASVNAYLGIGLRANEGHGHLLGGLKVSPDDRWTLGLQNEGHETHPFVTYRIDRQYVGLYLINQKRPALMWSWSR